MNEFCKDHDYEEGICSRCGFRYSTIQIAVHQLGHVWYAEFPPAGDGQFIHQEGGWRELSPPEARENLRQAEEMILNAGADGTLALQQALHHWSSIWTSDSIVCRLVGWRDLCVSDEGSRPLNESRGECDPKVMAHVACKRESRIEFDDQGTAQIVYSNSNSYNITGVIAQNGTRHIRCTGLIAGFLKKVDVSMSRSMLGIMLVFRASLMKERAARLLACNHGE